MIRRASARNRLSGAHLHVFIRAPSRRLELTRARPWAAAAHQVGHRAHLASGTPLSLSLSLSPIPSRRAAVPPCGSSDERVSGRRGEGHATVATSGKRTGATTPGEVGDGAGRGARPRACMRLPRSRPLHDCACEDHSAATSNFPRHPVGVIEPRIARTEPTVNGTKRHIKTT